jgi:uncharacterized coiled-coil protein SlyX
MTKCTDASCKGELIDQIYKSAGLVKDKLGSDLKDEVNGVYDYIKFEIKEIFNKIDKQRIEFSDTCEKTVKRIEDKIKDVITFPALMVSLGVTVSAVAIIVTAFTVVVTRANDRNNESLDNRIAAIEKTDDKQSKDIGDINVTIGKLNTIIDQLQKTADDLQDKADNLDRIISRERPAPTKKATE